MAIIGECYLICDVGAYEASGQCDCDCDCACAILVKNEVDVKSNISQLHATPIAMSSEIDLKFELRCGVYHRPVVVDHAAKQLISTFSRPRSLAPSEQEGPTSLLIKQMVKLGMLMPPGQPFSLADSHNLLTAWLQITNRCNLACHYCYSPKGKADMPVQVGYESLHAIFRAAARQNYSTVKLKYAGGEPLLQFPLIEQLHQYAQELSRNQDTSLEGVILTNGTLLTPQILETMQALGLQLMVSLDRLGGNHDCQRPYLNGNPSFEDVVKAIELAVTFGVVPDISITVSSRNVEDLPELIAWLLARDLPFSFNFYRENERSASHEDLKLEEKKIVRGLLTTYHVIESNLPERSLLSSIANRANLSVPHLRPCGVGKSYMVFDHQGNISKCQMQLDSPITSVGAQYPLTLVQQDAGGIQNLSVEDKEECQTCDWRYWCAGGCPVEAYRVTGRYNTKSPNCAIYKALFPEIVRLEGLRLLKYARDS
jgi:uncharacterized protein